MARDTFLLQSSSPPDIGGAVVGSAQLLLESPIQRYPVNGLTNGAIYDGLTMVHRRFSIKVNGDE